MRDCSALNPQSFPGAPQSFPDVKMPDQLEVELTSPEAAGLLRALAHRHGEVLAAAAGTFERLFLLRAPWAPGLRFAGGFVPSGARGSRSSLNTRMSVGGGGGSIEDALACCIGEAIERISQFLPPVAAATAASLTTISGLTLAGIHDRAKALCEQYGLSHSTTLSWTSAHVAATGEACLVPTDWCFHSPIERPFNVPGAALSTGVAAGPNIEAATLRAVLELIERDAVGLWWIGGRRARMPTIDAGAHAEAHSLLVTLRHGNHDRVSWILDLTTDVGVPVMAAISARPDGQGCAFGFAARLNARDAVRAAIFEMCQMELGLNIAEANELLRGSQALSDVDKGHLARARNINSATCDLLHPIGAAPEPTSGPVDNDSQSVRTLVRELSVMGIDVALVDLTRPEYGIPVMAAIAPELQLMPSKLETRRLRETIAATGGGARFTNAVSLF